MSQHLHLLSQLNKKSTVSILPHAPNNKQGQDVYDEILKQNRKQEKPYYFKAEPSFFATQKNNRRHICRIG
jgi:hypothetical protein